MTKIKTFCIKSLDNKCDKDCPRNLKGFKGIYIRIKNFDCEKELKGVKNGNA